MRIGSCVPAEFMLQKRDLWLLCSFIAPNSPHTVWPCVLRLWRRKCLWLPQPVLLCVHPLPLKTPSSHSCYCSSKQQHTSGSVNVIILFFSYSHFKTSHLFLSHTRNSIFMYGLCTVHVTQSFCSTDQCLFYSAFCDFFVLICRLRKTFQWWESTLWKTALSQSPSPSW